MSEDQLISECTADFVTEATYVDDGADSSQDIEKMETVASQLGPLFSVQKYVEKLLKLCGLNNR